MAEEQKFPRLIGRLAPPPMLVFPRREYASLKTETMPEDLGVEPYYPGIEALERVWDCDAHMVMYQLHPQESAVAPRLSKQAGCKKFLRDNGLHVLMRWVVLDIDTPGHKRWPEVPLSWWVEQLVAIHASADGRLASWYRTRGGYHLVWALEYPIGPDDWERYVAVLRARLRRDGIAINEECKDWTRLMRLPRVLRDGEQQDPEMDLSALKRGLKLNLLAHEPEPSSVSASEPAQPTQRSTPEPPALRLVPPVTPPAVSDWELVRVSGQLRKQLEAGEPFGNTPERRASRLGEQGRDTQILSVAGILVASMERPDVDTVVRLMLPSVLASRRDNPQQIGDEQTLRDRVRSVVEKELAKRPPPAPAPVPVQAQGVAEGRAGSDVFDAVPTPETDVSALPLVISTRVGRGYYVLHDRTGGYVGPHSSDHLAKAVLELCPSRGARAVGDKGAPREGKRIFHEDGAFVDHTILRAGVTESVYDARHCTLYEACAQWAVLQPEYHPQIDQWLRLLGGAQAERLLDWLATIRQISRPTAVLYVQGVKAVGKSMIWEGLAHLWQSKATVPYETLTASFDGQLAESLLVVADEGMSVAGEHRGSPSKVFRTAVTSSRRTIRRKHLPDAVLEACFRMVVTSNDDTALNLREQLSAESIEAIAERILYVVADPAAGEYLRELGGRSTTEAWVAGGGIARHVLWLEQTRQVTPGTRLLVEGSSEHLVTGVTHKVGVNRHVVAALCRYLDGYQDRRQRSLGERLAGDRECVYHPHMVVEEGDLFVNLEALKERWSLLHGTGDAVTRDALAVALRALSRGRKVRKRLEGKLVWVYIVDGRELLSASSTLGIGDPEAIAALVEPPVIF